MKRIRLDLFIYSLPIPITSMYSFRSWDLAFRLSALSSHIPVVLLAT